MKNCPRNIDKPITLLGLELEDLAIVVGLIGIIRALSNIFIAIAIAIVGGVILKRAKRGKPKAHIQHLFYRMGVSFPGFLPPIQRVKIYSPWEQEKEEGKR